MIRDPVSATASGVTFRLLRLARGVLMARRKGTASLRGRLKRYEEQIEQLRIENEHLRTSATMFGELAERLNKALRDADDREHTTISGGG